LAEVRLQEGESLENALRRFKRKVQAEDIIKEVKRHSYYLKPGEKRRLKEALGSGRCPQSAQRQAHSQSRSQATAPSRPPAVCQRSGVSMSCHEKLHGDERLTVLVVNLVDYADVRVVQCGCGFGFALEAAEGLRVVG
jgi:small subunit ribosomal protein S21